MDQAGRYHNCGLEGFRRGEPSDSTCVDLENPVQQRFVRFPHLKAFHKAFLTLISTLPLQGLGFQHFDHLGATLLALLQVFLVDGAYEVLHNSLESEPDALGLTLTYYVLITFTMTLVLFNLYVAVVVNTFQEVRKSMLSGGAETTVEAPIGTVTPTNIDTQKLNDVRILDQKGGDDAELECETESESPLLAAPWAASLLQRNEFQSLVSGTIVLHALAMTTDTDEESWLPRYILWLIYYTATSIFAGEWLLCFAADGASADIVSKRFRALEAILLSCGIAGLMTENRVLNLLPSIRVMRLCKYSATLQDLLKDCIETQRSFLILIVFITVVGLCFAVVGRYIFRGEMDSITRSNFGCLSRAMLTIFQLFTGDSWRCCIHEQIQTIMIRPRVVSI